MRIARSIAFATLVLLFGSLTPAQAGTLTYEVSGHLVVIGASDPMGLAGSQFHFTLTINSTSAPVRSESTNDRAVAMYDRGRSTLELRGTAEGALDGVHEASVERLEVTDTYAGDFCVAFASRFETKKGSVSAPTVCFAPGTARGAGLPAASLSSENAIGFHAVATSGGMYAVEGGSIEVRGGAR